MRQGDPRVFTVASSVKSSVDKTSKDLRDKRLLTFDSDKLTRVELQAKGAAVEFGKNNQNDWQILKPKPLRADGSQVEELIRKLKDAKMDTAVSDEDAKKAASGYASGRRVALATVTDSNGNQTLEVHEAGKDKDKTYYAKSSVVEGIYKVPNDLGEGVDKGLDDFRNKKLFDFAWSDPTKIQIGTVTYQKTGDKWMQRSEDHGFRDGPERDRQAARPELRPSFWMRAAAAQVLEVDGDVQRRQAGGESHYFQAGRPIFGEARERTQHLCTGR